MRVEINYCDIHEEDPESIGVYLDNGTKIGCYCIVEDAEKERDLLEKMLERLAL